MPDSHPLPYPALAPVSVRSRPSSRTNKRRAASCFRNNADQVTNRTMHALFSPRSDLRILWGPKHLHRLSGAVTTPLFRHLGLSSWHGFDGALLRRFRNDTVFTMPLWVFTAALVVSTVGVVIVGCTKYSRWKIRPARGMAKV